MDQVVVDSSGVRLSCEVSGPASAPTLVLLHGWPESARAFRRVVSLLDDRYRVVAFDQRGFGRSDKPIGTENYRMGVLVGDVLAVADEVGAGRFGVVGHDLGGSVAWALGALAPEVAAALVVMASPHPLHFRRVAARGLDQMRRAFYVWLLNAGSAGEGLLARDEFAELAGWVFAGSEVSESDRAAYRAEWAESGAFTAMAEWYRANYTPDLLNPAVPLELAPVRAAVRYLGPESDPAFAAGMHEGSGDFVDGPYDEQTVPGTTHWMTHDAPERVAGLIDEWMAVHL